MPGFADESTGLILLDLPDFDSTKAANREIVQRMVGLVDVLVWVLDPQKYADAAVHNDFLAPLASHGAVTLVVLNQVDLLPPPDIGPVLESLKAILARDGLGKVQVLGASALTGTGVDKVRAAIRHVALQRQALSQRLAADVSKASAQLAAASGNGEAAGVRAGTRSRLADELAAAANVPLVVEAVSRSYRHEATRRTGWPLTRWLVRFRPDPLRRLNLRREGASAEVNRTSLPPAGAPERARTDAAVREFADAASTGAPGPWRAAIRSAAREGRDQLPDALDQAIAGTDLLAGRKSWWWGLFNAVQWLALLAALGGLAWLGVLAGLGYLQLPVPEVPRVEGWPVPTLLIAGGVVLGIVLAIAAKIHRWRGCRTAGRRGTEKAQCGCRCRGGQNGGRAGGSRGQQAEIVQRGPEVRGPRLAFLPRSASLQRCRGVAHLDHGAQVARGGAGFVADLGRHLAERAVQGAAGGCQPGHRLRTQSLLPGASRRAPASNSSSSMALSELSVM